MYKIDMRNLDTIINNLPEDVLSPYIVNKTELSKKINDTINSKNTFSGFIIENNDYITSIKINYKDKLDELIKLINQFKVVEIYDIVLFKSNKLQDLILSMSRIDTDKLVEELTTLDIDIIDEKILYINPKTVNNILNKYELSEDLQNVKELLNESIEITNKKKNKLFSTKKNKELCDKVINDLTKANDGIEEIISITSKIHFEIESATNKLFRLSNELFNDIKYSKEFI